MSWLGAKTYDFFMKGPEAGTLAEWRNALLAGASGDVLEIGAGTGANLDYYPTELGRLVLSEPDAYMRSRLVKRAEGRPNVELTTDDAGALTAEDDSFDVVVSTLVLCSVRDLDAALAQIRRVLRPSGRLLFLEHVADEEGTARLRWQQRLDSTWQFLMDNCHLARRTEAAISSAGFEIEQVEYGEIVEDFVLVQPAIRGVARNPGVA